jgi:hypothetical protein
MIWKADFNENQTREMGRLIAIAEEMATIEDAKVILGFMNELHQEAINEAAERNKKYEEENPKS